MTHLGTVQLETERLILRRFTAADDAAMFENWASDDDMTEFMSWPTHTSIDTSRGVLNDWIANYEKLDYYQWAMELKRCGTLIGAIGVVGSKEKIKMIEMGYGIGKAWWRKGYTSEALVRLLTFFFEDVGMNRVEAVHDTRNPGSGKVMEKSGLRYEGTLREAGLNNQGVCDKALYAMLAKDYFN